MTNEQHRIQKLEQKVRELEEVIIKMTGRNYDDFESIHRRINDLTDPNRSFASRPWSKKT